MGKYTTWKKSFFILCVLFSSSTPLFADDDPAPCSGPMDCDPVIAQLLKHLGSHLGFTLMNPWNADESNLEMLVDLTSTKGAQQNLVMTQLGALTTATQTANGGNPTIYNISTNDVLPFLNTKLNATLSYTNPPTPTDPHPAAFALTQNPKIDQLPYQIDPVDQILLNLLTTPPAASSCPGYDAKQNPTPKNCLSLDLVTQNAITIPDNLNDYYNPKGYDSTPLLPVLNNNSLATPLLLSTETGESSSDLTVDKVNTFIRYVSGTIVPDQLPDSAVLQQLALHNNTAAFQDYLAALRSYVSQVSVGLSNLYYILSKRLPQPDLDNKLTSQALNEYTMATWRLFPIAGETGKSPDEKTEWLYKINHSNVTTLQKEMVTLLAEINYQLYLNRQQQERLLLTNSVLLLISTKSVKPQTSALVAALNPNSDSQSSGPPPAP